MKNLLAALKWFFCIWGMVSACLFLTTIVSVFWGFYGPSQEKRDFATPRDIHFLGGNIGGAHLEKIVHSYQSDRSFTGDHVDAYEVQLSPVNAEELAQAKDIFGDPEWYRGDQLPKVLQDAVRVGFGQEVPWFPLPGELASTRVYIRPVHLSLTGLRLFDFEYVVLRPSDGRAWYIDVKT